LKATAFVAQKGVELVTQKAKDQAKTNLQGDAASQASMAISAAGAIAGASISILESVGDSILHFIERDNNIKAFRRAVRSNVLSALEGVALNWRTKQKVVNKEPEEGDDGSIVPDFKAEDTNCFHGLVNVMHMILQMIDPAHDDKVFPVFPTCVSSKWSEFKEHWFSNAVSLKIDYPERYSHLLAFVSRRSGFDEVLADSIGFPDNALKTVFSGVVGEVKNQIGETYDKFKEINDNKGEDEKKDK